MFQRPCQTGNICRGFTLIEILVVIVLVGISVSVVVLNIPISDDDDAISEEVTRLQQLLVFAHEQAVIRSEEYGVRFYKSGYRFMQYDHQSEMWVDIESTRLLRSRQLDDMYELDLYIDQLPIDIPDSEQDDPEIKIEDSKLQTIGSTLSATPEVEEDEKILPQVFLLSSSELAPPFELRLRIPGSDHEKLLIGSAEGRYTLLKDEQDD